MVLGGTQGMAWIIMIGFVLIFVLPVLYLTYLSMRRDRHTAAVHLES